MHITSIDQISILLNAACGPTSSSGAPPRCGIGMSAGGWRRASVTSNCGSQKRSAPRRPGTPLQAAGDRRCVEPESRYHCAPVPRRAGRAQGRPRGVNAPSPVPPDTPHPAIRSGARASAADGARLNPFRRFHREGLCAHRRANSRSRSFNAASFGDFGGRASQADRHEFHTSWIVSGSRFFTRRMSQVRVLSRPPLFSTTSNPQK